MTPSGKAHWLPIMLFTSLAMTDKEVRIASALALGEWTKFSESKPIIADNLLLACKQGAAIGWFSSSGDFFVWAGHDIPTKTIDLKFTHWMDIPELKKPSLISAYPEEIRQSILHKYCEGFNYPMP